MEWRNVWSNTGGTYRMSISYASAEDRSLTVRVNGRQVASLSRLNSNDFTRSWKTVGVTVTLKKGLNRIALGSTDGFAPNVDKMTLHKYASK